MNTVASAIIAALGARFPGRKIVVHDEAMKPSRSKRRKATSDRAGDLLAKCRRLARDAADISRRRVEDLSPPGDIVSKNRIMRDADAKKLKAINSANRAMWAPEVRK